MNVVKLPPVPAPLNRLAVTPAPHSQPFGPGVILLVLLVLGGLTYGGMRLSARRDARRLSARRRAEGPKRQPPAAQPPAAASVPRSPVQRPAGGWAVETHGLTKR